MKITLQDLRDINSKILRQSNYETKGNIAKDGFKMSCEYVKQENIIPADKHNNLDMMVDTIIQKRGLGWFSQKYDILIPSVKTNSDIISFLKSWIDFYNECQK